MASPVHYRPLVSSVVNGNIIRPTLLRGTVDSRGVLTEQAPAPVQTVFSEATADKLRQMMIYAVENGTGTHGAPSIGGAGGKTGTAQTGWVVDGEAVVQGWYAGFYPAEKPEYVIVVLAEDYEGSGGMPATTFRQICDELSCLKPCAETNGIVISVSLRYESEFYDCKYSTAQKTEHYLSAAVISQVILLCYILSPKKNIL